MTTLLDDFGTYLLPYLQGFVTSIKKDSMPPEGDDSVCVYEYQGSSPVPQVEGHLRRVQIVARSKNSLRAREMCAIMYKALQTEDSILNLTPQRWMSINLKQPPFKFKTDDQNRIYFCFNISCITYYE